MPALAAMTLVNNAAANVVFSPNMIDPNGVAIWYTQNSIIDARSKATLSVRQPKPGSSVARVVGKISIPVMDTVDSTKKVSEVLGTFEFVLPKQATETQRLDIRKMMDTMLMHANLTSACQYLETVY